MKRFFSVLMMCVLSSVFLFAAPGQATLTPVARTHQRAHRHRAHKAGRHHTPKRAHGHTV